jgi:hypothetical protein
MAIILVKANPDKRLKLLTLHIQTLIQTYSLHLSLGSLSLVFNTKNNTYGPSLFLFVPVTIPIYALKILFNT